MVKSDVQKDSTMLYVLTGNGKGKSTSAMGQMLRSLGRGWKVCLIQLFKGREFYGEQKMFKHLPGLTFHSCAHKHPFCFPKTDSSMVNADCMKAVRHFQKAAASGRYQLIILEEFNIAFRDGFLDYAVFKPVLESAIKTGVHVIMTGRGAPKELIKRADLVTEMKEVKHPYKKGVAALKGIEF